jgi:hypothetical protein
MHVAQHLPAEGFDSPLCVGSTARSCAAMAALTCLLRLARHAGTAPRKSDSRQQQTATVQPLRNRYLRRAVVRQSTRKADGHVPT